MTRRVGRSDGSHPKHADGHSSLSLRSLAYAARGAVAPSGPLRSPVPVSGERLVGCPREAFVIEESGLQARSARLRAAPNGA